MKPAPMLFRPDAHIYINETPVLSFCDDAIAGVIAHELGHNEKKILQISYERLMIQQVGMATP